MSENMMSQPLGLTLPPEFADLEQFSGWALNAESERMQKRLASSMDEITQFYSAMLARVDDALTYLNDYPLADLDPAQQRLMNMTLSLAEVWVAVELYDQPDHPFGLELSRFVPGESYRP